ncbi:MAG: NAD(P)-dependent oxidoreductase [Acidibrevibacterium sp.]|uniref:NAD(P)-dependent oxidoreductase n=1 Tax=Acidibrevibacterium sp. TaxID=2606776 RepID=UPI003D011F8D
MRGLFLDADDTMAAIFARLQRSGDPAVTVNRAARIAPEDLPRLLAGYDFVLDDHSALPTAALAACPALRHVIFLGTGARSYMNPEELAALGITVHTIKGYGDTAVAEHSIALMWAAARGIAAMDRGVRAGGWPRIPGVQLTGKTLGLIGFGGIAAEVARIATGSGMRVLAWNRSPKTAAGVSFVGLDTLLAESDVVSLHLLLTDETRGFLDAGRLARLRPGVILVNTARGALVDEAALIAGLEGGHIGHAALDVFATEPLPADHPLTRLANVTLSAHSGFLTPEANETLLQRALEIARGLCEG